MRNYNELSKFEFLMFMRNQSELSKFEFKYCFSLEFVYTLSLVHKPGRV